MAKRAQALTGVRANHPREMALIDKSKIGGEDGETVVPVGQTFECDRDANSIPELRERHAGDSGEDAANVKARVTESLGYAPKVRAGWIRDDRLSSFLNDAVVIGSGWRATCGEASLSGALGEGTDKLCEPLVEFETIYATPQRGEQFAMTKFDDGCRRDRLVGHRCVAS